MTIHASTLIKAAQERVPCFSDTIIGPSVAIRLLSDVQRELHGQALMRNPHYLLTTLDILTVPANAALIPIVVDTGYTISTSMVQLIDVTVTFRDLSTQPVSILTADTRSILTSPRLSCYLLNNLLYLNGLVADWADVTKITCRYQITPGDLAFDYTTVSEAMLLPDNAMPPLVAMMAVAILDRMIGAGAVADEDQGGLMARLEKRADSAVKTFLDQVSQVGVPRTMPTVEVW